MNGMNTSLRKDQIKNLPHSRGHEVLPLACTSMHLEAVRILSIPRKPMPLSMEQADKVQKEVLL